MTREWFRLDVGLLEDERFAGMSFEMVGIWTKTYMVIKREGGSFKSVDRLAYLLGRQGFDDPAEAIARLTEAGWFVEHPAGGQTLRGYVAAQEAYRGPSDMPEAKAERNAKRPTTRAGRRGASVERRGASVAEDRGATRGASGATHTNGTDTPPGRKRARESESRPVPLANLVGKLPWVDPGKHDGS